MMKKSDWNIPVVVIDDEPGILFLHELMLTESNLSDQISAFFNPKDGLDFILETVRSQSPILVLLDINMPVMNGWEILEQLDELNLAEKVHVIMVTSSIQKSDREKSLKYTAVKMYVEKPIDLAHCEMIKKSLSEGKWK
jgi:CheY-like chemotaxis protein